MGRGRPETIIQPDGIKPYNWEGQYGTVASYRDGKSHVWQHNKEQPQQQDQQGQFPGGVINVSGTCMRLYNESTLSIRQTDYTGLSGYVNIYGNMCMNVQHALELRNSSQLDIQNSHIRGSAFNSSRSENCGASGIYCRGTGVVSIEASDARSNELRTTEILGGNAIQKSIKPAVPGHGIEVWNNCALYVGSSLTNNDNAAAKKDSLDDKIVISAGSYVIDPRGGSWLGHKRDPPDRLSSAIKLYESSATLYGGTYWGPNTVSLSKSNITIYGGSFYNRALGEDDQDNDGIRHKFGFEKCKGNTALKIQRQSSAFIYGGNFYESFQNDISSCLEVSSNANVSIYGGNFQGTWSLWREHWIDRDKVHVYGRSFRLVKDGRKHPGGTTISRRLKGTLCDGNHLSVRIHTGVALQNVSLLFSFHSCEEQDYFDPALSAPNTVGRVFLLIVAVALAVGMGYARHQKKWCLARMNGDAATKATTYARVATGDIEMRTT
uniref:Uncharacterized protein n=1 Tax=Amphora coffeiformis TaxID=265554 RepID=A0A7S3LG58_9STRA